VRQSRWGGFLLAGHTRRHRKTAKLLEITEDLQRRWHQDFAEQGQWLGAVVRGFFAYQAVPTNARALSTFRQDRRNCVHVLPSRSVRVLGESATLGTGRADPFANLAPCCDHRR